LGHGVVGKHGISGEPSLDGTGLVCAFDHGGELPSEMGHGEVAAGFEHGASESCVGDEGDTDVLAAFAEFPGQAAVWEREAEV